MRVIITEWIWFTRFGRKFFENEIKFKNIFVYGAESEFQILKKFSSSMVNVIFLVQSYTRIIWVVLIYGRKHFFFSIISTPTAQSSSSTWKKNSKIILAPYVKIKWCIEGVEISFMRILALFHRIIDIT